MNLLRFQSSVSNVLAQRKDLSKNEHIPLISPSMDDDCSF